jgi:hypothetical protein
MCTVSCLTKRDIVSFIGFYKDKKRFGVIVYDLKCDKNHKFEGWFKDRASFEEQKEKKLISCPICGSFNVGLLISSVAIMGKGPAKSDEKKELSPMKALKILHEYIDKTFEDVGSRFADVALKMHRNEEERKNIKGTTTKDEEETLKEEGVDFVKIPIPKFNS